MGLWRTWSRRSARSRWWRSRSGPASSRPKLLGCESGVVRDPRRTAGGVDLAIIGGAPQNDFGAGKDEIIVPAGEGLAGFNDLHFSNPAPGKGRGFEALGGGPETEMVLEVSEAAAGARASPCGAAGRTPLHGPLPTTAQPAAATLFFGCSIVRSIPFTDH